MESNKLKLTKRILVLLPIFFLALILLFLPSNIQDREQLDNAPTSASSVDPNSAPELAYSMFQSPEGFENVRETVVFRGILHERVCDVALNISNEPFLVNCSLWNTKSYEGGGLIGTFQTSVNDLNADLMQSLKTQSISNDVQWEVMDYSYILRSENGERSDLRALIYDDGQDTSIMHFACNPAGECRVLNTTRLEEYLGN